MPTLWQGVVVPEKLEYFWTWIQHQPATVFAQGELVLQITKDAETLCSYHALQIVPLIGGIRRDKDGNCERVEQWYSDTDRQEISQEKTLFDEEKNIVSRRFFLKSYQLHPIALCNIIQTIILFWGIMSFPQDIVPGEKQQTYGN